MEQVIKKVKEYLCIIVGTIMMAAAVNLIYEPMNMVTGGVSGFAIIIKRVTGALKGGIPIWLTNALVNIPLFVAAYYVKGRLFIKKTLIATLSFTAALYFIPTIPIQVPDFLLAALVGGIITGTGLGFVFIAKTSTGGTDLLGIILQKFFPHYSVAQLLMVIDSAIVLAGAAIFGLNRALYAVIAVFITSKVIDGILEGLHFAKMAYIITSKEEQIEQDILYSLDRGVTQLDAKGVYSGDKRTMLLCVVSTKEIVKLIDIVTENDKSAFVIVSDVREVMGEGFIEYKQ